MRPSAWWSVTGFNTRRPSPGSWPPGGPRSMIYCFNHRKRSPATSPGWHLAAVVADREDWTHRCAEAARLPDPRAAVISDRDPEVASVAGLGHRDRCAPHAAAEAWGGAEDPHQRHHRTAQEAGDQVTHVLERTVFSVTAGEKASVGCAAGVRVLAVRRHRGLPADRGHLQRPADRDARAVHRRRVGRRRQKASGARSGVQPAVIRMLLDADVPRADLASLDS